MSRNVLYWAEPLPGGRAQMMADLVVDSRIVQTWPVGSPAPLETVDRAVAEYNGAGVKRRPHDV